MNKKQDSTHLRRFIALILVCVITFGAACTRLFDYQIIHGEDYLSDAEKNSAITVPIKAARGEILDRNGVPLTKNRVSYNVVFEYAYTNDKALNETIVKLIKLFEEKKETWEDQLPISLTSPYSFHTDSDDEIAALKKKIDVNTYATADNCLAWLYRNYGIKKYEDSKGKCTHCGEDFDQCTFTDYDEATARKIAGVRYSMLLMNFSKYNSEYIFASDISSEMVAFLKERSADFPGIQISQTAVRTYVSGDVASHLIGRVNSIPADEWEEYKKKGYGMSDKVGVSGLEYALEDVLRGTDGEKTITLDKNGNVIGETVTKPAVQGKSVKLNIDYYFQKEVQAHVANWITQYNAQHKALPINEGAMVILDPKTGGVLASISYPFYDINTMIDDYDSVANAPNKPLINRAINGTYRPGSTFKPIVATAGLMEGIVNTSSTVYCGHYYTFYPDWNPPPTCLNSGHRNVNINVTQALRYSCNIYFYDVGRRLGISKINEYAKKFGLGVNTGLEIKQETGHLSSPEYSESLGAEWYPGNVIQASIGQMDTNITPLQMASEAMTLSNKGVRYETHLVKSYLSSDGTEEAKEKKVASTLSISDANFNAMVEGMNHVADNLSSTKYSLNNLGYHVAVKTGSPQVSTTKSNHAFIAFAPSDDADICISSMMVDAQPGTTQMIRGILLAWQKAKDRQAEIQAYYQGLLDGTVTGAPQFSWEQPASSSSEETADGSDSTLIPPETDGDQQITSAPSTAQQASSGSSASSTKPTAATSSPLVEPAAILQSDKLLSLYLGKANSYLS